MKGRCETAACRVETGLSSRWLLRGSPGEVPVAGQLPEVKTQEPAPKGSVTQLGCGGPRGREAFPPSQLSQVITHFLQV